MKIILSRKGFDSTTGEIASPIMEDGSLLSLPIPVTKKQAEGGEEGITYEELMFGQQNLSTIIDELSNGNFDADQQAHLDPDLDKERLANREDEKNWKPVFGQQGTAQGYLEKREVGNKEEDIFLFFGWFQRTKKDNGKLCYLRPREGRRDLHVIFGWLQVGKRIIVNRDEIQSWLEYHPHVVNKKDVYTGNNTIYVASDTLNLFGEPICGKSGGGAFPVFKESLLLTAREQSMSHWSLPKWLLEGAWKCRDGHLPFLSGGRQQEFVFDVPDIYKQEAIDWLKEMF